MLRRTSPASVAPPAETMLPAPFPQDTTVSLCEPCLFITSHSLATNGMTTPRRGNQFEANSALTSPSSGRTPPGFTPFLDASDSHDDGQCGTPGGCSSAILSASTISPTFPETMGLPGSSPFIEGRPFRPYSAGAAFQCEAMTDSPTSNNEGAAFPTRKPLARQLTFTDVETTLLPCGEDFCAQHEGESFGRPSHGKRFAAHVVVASQHSAALRDHRLLTDLADLERSGRNAVSLLPHPQLGYCGSYSEDLVGWHVQYFDFGMNLDVDVFFPRSFPFEPPIVFPHRSMSVLHQYSAFAAEVAVVAEPSAPTIPGASAQGVLSCCRSQVNARSTTHAYQSRFTCWTPAITVSEWLRHLAVLLPVSTLEVHG